MIQLKTDRSTRMSKGYSRAAICLVALNIAQTKIVEYTYIITYQQMQIFDRANFGNARAFTLKGLINLFSDGMK